MKLLNKTDGQIRSKVTLLGLKKSPEWKTNPLSGNIQKGENRGSKTVFKKGHKPHNKGVAMEKWMSEDGIKKSAQGRFTKGHLSHNAKYDGAITPRYHVKDKRTYLYIRLGNSNWELLHRKVWMDANGPIPDGYLIAFKDGNSTNCELDNLYLMSRKDNMLKNSIHNLYPEDIKKTIIKLSHLKRIINGKKQNH